MLGLPRSAKPYRTAAVLALFITVALTGCTSDKTPTAAQAGQTLKTHILQLLNEGSADDVIVVDPGGKDIPCAQGKAKQTFAATGRDLPQRKPDALVDSLLGALKRVASYEIVSVGEPGRPVRVQNVKTQTILILSAPENGKYAIRGETWCLCTG